MYISDTNYHETIDNLEDCMFALSSMHQDILAKGFATDEDLEYIEPRFTGFEIILLSMLTKLTPQDLQDTSSIPKTQRGHQVYEALGIFNTEDQ
ncbi:MAG: hypothetical protein CM15mV81_320 [uncultured marine virus]|nr:MAG: hypothetical protein CM15mV81_320 [uncultured marine virus]